MCFVETITASLIFKCNKNTLRQSAKRNSLKYPFIKVDANTRSRGGKRLLFKVDALKIKEAIGKNIISIDIKIWDEKLNLVSVDEILSGGCDDNLGDDSLGGGLGGGAIDGVGAMRGKLTTDGVLVDDTLCGKSASDISVSNSQSLSQLESKSSSTHLNLEPLERDKKTLNLDEKNAVCGGSHSVGSHECGCVGSSEFGSELGSEFGCVGGSKFGCVGGAISHENLGADAIHNNAKFSHLKTLNENQKLEVIAYSKKYSVKKASKFFGVSDKNIYRWLKEFENGGIKEIKDKRGKRIKADLTLIKQAILSIGNAHKSSWWMEYVRRFCLRNNLEFNAFNLEADISKSTFYRHANMLIKKDADIRNFLRGGLDGLADMNLSVKRDYLMENEEWQIDATNFDFMCLNQDNKPQRYTAIGMIDAKSGKRVYELADSPNSYANVRLLKKAFIKMGHPGYIKGDNGKDYIGAHFQGVLARLGVSYIATAPFKGAQKGVIERSHGVMQNFFEGLPGFIGHNAGHRIKKENEALEKSKRLSGVKTNIKNLLTKDEMQSMINSWCDKKYGVSKGVDTSWFDERLFGKAYQSLNLYRL